MQGVSFRYYTQRAALKLGVDGAVRNLWNGNVEVWAKGGDDAMAQFEAFLRTGPSAARVSGLQKTETDPAVIAPGFEITY